MFDSRFRYLVFLPGVPSFRPTLKKESIASQGSRFIHIRLEEVDAK